MVIASEAVTCACVSGPKVFSYEVQRRFERTFRALDVLVMRVDEIAEQWQALCQECEEAQPWTGEVQRRLMSYYNGPKLSIEVWEGLARTFGQEIAQLEAELEEAREKCARIRKEEAMAQLGASLRAAALAAEQQAQAEERERAEERQHADEQAREQIAERISTMLGSLADDAPTEERRAITDRAEEAAAAAPGRQRMLLLQLRLDIQRTNEKAKARQRVMQQARKLREDLAGLGGSEVEELDTMLQRAAEGQGALPADMGQRVTEAAARATEARNRDYVMEVVAGELENLGYVVEEEFETASADAPELVLRKAGMAEDYHVSLRVDAATAQLEAKVVREAEAGGRRDANRRRLDRQAETAWCGDVAAAMAAAQNQGVHARVVSRQKPGEVPVETIAPFRGWARPKSESQRRRDRMRRTRGRMAQMSR